MKASGFYNPAFQKKFVALPPPTLSDNVCDLARLEQGLSRQHGLDSLAADFFMLRHLAQVMREDNFRVTATLDFAQRRSRKPRVVQVESGDTSQRHFAIAIDIGTTTVGTRNFQPPPSRPRMPPCCSACTLDGVPVRVHLEMNAHMEPDVDTARRNRRNSRQEPSRRSAGDGRPHRFLGDVGQGAQERRCLHHGLPTGRGPD